MSREPLEVEEQHNTQPASMLARLGQNLLRPPVENADVDDVENHEPWDDENGEPHSGEYGVGPATFQDHDLSWVNQTLKHDIPKQGPPVTVVRLETPETLVLNGINFPASERSVLIAPRRPNRASVRVTFESGGPFYLASSEGASYTVDTARLLDSDFPYFDEAVTGEIWCRNIGGAAGRVTVQESLYGLEGGHR